jgi:hypothetical protein
LRGALVLFPVLCGNLRPIRRGRVGDPREQPQKTAAVVVERRVSRMSRSLDQLRGSSAKIAEGEGETFEFLRDGVEFFGIPTGRDQWGCGRTAVRAKVYKAGRKQFL